MNRERVIERVRALLALAVDNPSGGEAHSALDIARTKLAGAGLRLADLLAPTVDVEAIVANEVAAAIRSYDADEQLVRQEMLHRCAERALERGIAEGRRLEREELHAAERARQLAHNIDRANGSRLHESPRSHRDGRRDAHSSPGSITASQSDLMELLRHWR